MVRIGEPARKHGVADEDINHAERHHIRRIPMDDDFTMLIGPACNGALLEIGVVGHGSDNPGVVHAMPATQKYLDVLRERGDRHA